MRIKSLNPYFNIILLAVCLSISSGKAFAQGWQWSGFPSGPQTSIAQAVATDRWGNVFVAGAFLGDSLTFGGIILTNAGNQNIFLVKYNNSGNVIWAHRYGGMYTDGATALATDSSGNVVITGYFTSAQLRFDSVIIKNDYQNFVEGGESTADAFIAKLDSSGHTIWAKDIGGIGSEMVNSVAIGPSGSVNVCGTFNSDSLYFGTDLVLTHGGYDFFIVRYSSAGVLLWHTQEGGTKSDGAYGIATDLSDNVFVTGNFTSLSIAFGSTVLSYPDSVNHVFIAKYNSLGTIQWVTGTGGDKDDLATAITVDKDGYPYITGTYSSSYITFGYDTLYNTTSFGNMYLAKFNHAGLELWLQGARPHDNVYPQSICNDTSGNLYCSGYFCSNTASLGSCELSNYSNGGYADIFLAKYSNGGTPLWVSTAGGVYDDVAYGVSADLLGNVYVSGYYNSPQFYLGFLEDSSSQGTNVFVAKFNEARMQANTVLPELKNIKVYPNPTSGDLFISTEHNNSYKYIAIYDCLGSLRYEEHITNNVNSTVINTRNFSEGVYYLKLVNELGSTVIPVMVKR